MDIAKAWGVALLGYLLGSVLFGWVAASAGDPERIGSGPEHLLWTLAPPVLLDLVTAALAAIVHGRGHGAVRHAVAVLTVPAVLLVIGVVGGLVSGVTPGDTLLSAGAAVLATVGGWQAVDRLRRDTTRTETYW